MIQIAACEGMKFYRDAAKRTWKLGDYTSKDEPTLFLGMYFKEDVVRLKDHVGPKFLFWNGSDVSRTLASPAWHEPILRSGAVHACHNQALADELATIGIKAEVSPTLFDHPEAYEKRWTPCTHPRVYMTVHPGREEEYGLSMAADIMRYADADLYVYGNAGGRARIGNIHLRGVVTEDQWKEETKWMQGALRLNKHDGTSQIVIKAILRGHYAIVTPKPWEAFKGVQDLGSELEANPDSIPNLNGWINKVLEV